ncbi:S4 domain-containing protein [Bacillaceae bacterium]
MRLDKFLKVSRLIKRRTLAKEVCEQGRVFLNGQPAKASSTVKPGDELSIRFAHKILVVRVEKLVDTSRKEEAADLYAVIEEKAVSQTKEQEEDMDYPAW